MTATPTTQNEPGATNARPQLLQAITRRPATFVLTLLLVAAAVAVPLSLSESDEYRARATLLIDNPRQQAADGERRVATSSELLELRTVAAGAARQLGDVSVSEVQDRVEVEPASPADIVHIDASASTPEAAVTTANAYAQAYLDLPRGGGAARPSLQAPDARLVQNAVDAEKVFSAPLLRNVGLGLLAGLIASLALMWLRERFERRVGSTEEFEELYDLPLLARIPKSRSLSNEGNSVEAIDNTLGFSEEAEAFRSLRTNLRYFNVDSPVRSMLLVSPLPGDGKSTIARHLAVTMASMGDSVCLVHADLRKHVPGRRSATDGLSLVLAGFDLDEALTEMPVSFDPISEESRTLVELPSGPLPPNPAELLESARMRWLIKELERRFDVVIIDSAALVTVSDALSLVPQVSGVLVVGGVRKTVRQAALDLRKQIEFLGGRTLGVVANFSSRSPSYYHGPYYD
jgi:polysaccharide biosynthesis transport protein